MLEEIMPRNLKIPNESNQMLKKWTNSKEEKELMQDDWAEIFSLKKLLKYGGLSHSDIIEYRTEQRPSWPNISISIQATLQPLKWH